MILLDTNVLVYSINADAPQHEDCQRVLQAAFDRRQPGVVVPQILLEFLAIVTNPRRVTRPLDPLLAWDQVTMFRANLPVLELRPTALTVLGELIAGHHATGRRIFDLFLVAQMRTHGIRTICTYNGPDFERLPDVDVVTPEDLLEEAT